MPPALTLAFLAAPAALIAAAFVAFAEPGLRPRRALLAARLATIGALLVAIAAAVTVAISGPVTSPLLGLEGAGLSLRLDALSVVMFLLVAFVGAVVVQFSRNYLDGDARQGLFTGRLCLTLAAVTLLVLSGNLVQLVAAWIATSLALHKLLVFYPERPKAVLAARKKFITARLGDVCLIAAAILLAQAFGTIDIATLLSAAKAVQADAVPSGVGWAALLIAGAALLKSAQFPTHGWLPEVMETPTPVSALLHAGIINAGGFLVIRFADIMLLSAPSMHLLALVGGFTALFGAVVMLTQTSVKLSLAWSTVAQMGFMLLQCGLGLFSLAVLHIVAHSLYKAHAFLASGSIVDLARAAVLPRPAPASMSILFASLGLAIGLYIGIGWLFGAGQSLPVQVLALGTILIMGVTLMLAQGMAAKGDVAVMTRSGAAAAAVTLAYFALHAGATAILGSSLPPPPPADEAVLLVALLAVASFGLVTVLQILAPSRSASPTWRAARVHLSNGLYANALFNRLVGALERPSHSLK